MQFWLDDETNFSVLEKIRECGLLSGITLEKGYDKKEIQNLLNLHNGPLAITVSSSESEEMIDEGKDLYDYSSRIIVKIPAGKEGYRAIYRLAHARIPTMAAGISSPLQALFAAKAGASHLAFLPSHHADLFHLLPLMVRNYHFECQLIAHISNEAEVYSCIENGIDGAALQESFFRSSHILEEAKAFQ